MAARAASSRGGTAANRAASVTPVIESDDLWPRTAEFRYRLYGLRGETLEVLAAAPTPQGLGLAIATLDGDAQEAGGSLGDEGATGVLDVCAGARGRWVVSPWVRP